MAAHGGDVSRRFAIWSLTPMSGNLAVEGLLSRVLRQRGFEPWVVRCNGGRERCNTDMVNPTVGSRTFLCMSCVTASESRLAEWAGEQLPMRLLTDLIDHDRLQAGYAAAAATADADLWAFTYDGLPFGSWLEVALRLEYFGENWQELPDLIEVARTWLRSTLAVWAAAHGYFAIERPAGVVAISGLLPGDKALQAVAEQYGVRCVFYEGGQRPGSIILRLAEPACRYAFDDEWPLWADVPLSVAESGRLDAFFRARQSHGADMTYVYSPARGDDPAALRERLGLRVGRPLLLVFTGLVVDSAVFEAHAVFPSQGAWLEACVAYAEAHPELDMVVRVHPVEQTAVRFAGADIVTVRDPAAEVIRRRWPVLPDNVRVIEADQPVSSYDLLPLATLVLTYISTISIEAAAFGKPVLAAGRSHFQRLGFVWPVTSPAALARQLTDLLAQPVAPPHAVELARRYAFFWFLRATPILPGLPDEVGDVVKRPPSPLPYWEGAGDAGDLETIGAFLVGEGPFVAPPSPRRFRDVGEPLPIRSPEEAVMLVWMAGWDPAALADRVLRPWRSQRRRWQFVLVAETQALPAAAACFREAMALAGVTDVPVRLVPLDAAGVPDPAWSALAAAYVPPVAPVAAAALEAAAHGWPRWEALWAPAAVAVPA